jgi:hypothetical protein
MQTVSVAIEDHVLIRIHGLVLIAGPQFILSRGKIVGNLSGASM